MKNLLENFDFIIPIISGMPIWFKYVFYFWFICSLIMFVLFIFFYYQKNRTDFAESYKNKVRVAETIIKRSFDDFEFEINNLKKAFPRENKQLQEKLSWEEKSHSGEEVKTICALGLKYQEQAFELKRELIRRLEDVLIDKFNTKDIDDVQELHDLSIRLNSLIEKYNDCMKKFEAPSADLAAADGRAKLIFEEYFEKK